MKDARRMKIEEAAKERFPGDDGAVYAFVIGSEWSDANPRKLEKPGIKLCPKCERVETSTLRDVCTRCSKIDPHPDTVDAKSDDEAASSYVFNRPMLGPAYSPQVELARTKMDFLAGIAHARKSQAAEIARMRDLWSGLTQ